MKTGAKLRTLTVSQALRELEKTARVLAKSAQWANPYSVAGRKYRAPVKELRQALAELSLARRTLYLE